MLEKTNSINVSELRTGVDEILSKIENGIVVIEKRHKPQAVLMSNKEYERLIKLADIAEDLVLGFKAQERYENSRESDYVDIKSLFIDKTL